MDDYETDQVKPAPGNAPHTIDLGEFADDWRGQSVTIRPHLSYAASQRIEVARMRMSTLHTGNREQRRAGGGSMEMLAAATPLEYASAVVAECVQSWTLLGYDGEVLAANAAGVASEQAPAEVLDVVVDEIVGYYEARRPQLRTRR